MFKGAVLRYLISDALSLLGNSIAGVVLPLVLLARTGDALAAGSLALICAVPQFVLGIVGGAVLDRVNRKAICVASDLISALSVALLPVIDATVGLSFGWFVALGLLGATTLLSFGITMVMGAWQGIVLPAYFTSQRTPELAGVFISAMGIGMLLGSLIYTALSSRLSRRGWFVLSLVGMAAGVSIMGTLPAMGLLLVSAAAVGLFSGPASALLGFFAYERIPEERRGSAMGTLNALYLVVAPAGTFLGSTLIAGFGIERTFMVLAIAWIAVTAVALAAPTLRNLDDEPA